MTSAEFSTERLVFLRRTLVNKVGKNCLNKFRTLILKIICIRF